MPIRVRRTNQPTLTDATGSVLVRVTASLTGCIYGVPHSGHYFKYIDPRRGLAPPKIPSTCKPRPPWMKDTPLRVNPIKRDGVSSRSSRAPIATSDRTLTRILAKINTTGRSSGRLHHTKRTTYRGVVKTNELKPAATCTKMSPSNPATRSRPATNGYQVKRRTSRTAFICSPAAILLTAVFGTSTLEAADNARESTKDTTGERQTSFPSRNEIWRQIFARPAPVKPTPQKEERIKLGTLLFFDTRLSGQNRTSCASCHNPNRAFTDGRKTGIGPSGTDLGRNVPMLLNLANATAFFWDGRAKSLEQQAQFPILATNEMNGSFDVIRERLSKDADMVRRFKSAFPASPQISQENILTAIADYERSLKSEHTVFDFWVAGDDAALSQDELSGLAIFVGKGGCVACHGGWRFTDDQSHDIGLPVTHKRKRSAQNPKVAREENTPTHFKTPSLRELTHTAPYMHDGSKATLSEVINHYTDNIEIRPSLAQQIKRNLSLSGEERRHLELFLRTLSSKK